MPSLCMGGMMHLAYTVHTQGQCLCYVICPSRSETASFASDQVKSKEPFGPVHEPCKRCRRRGAYLDHKQQLLSST